MVNNSADALPALKREYDNHSLSSAKAIPQLPFRDALQGWLLDALPESNCSLHTRMLANCYLDTFLNEKPETNMAVCHLVALLCLSTAMKVEQNCVFSLEYISEFFEHKFNTETICMLEIYILKTLNWRVIIPTPASIIRLIIGVFFEENDHTSLVEKADLMGIVGLIHSDIACSGEFLISIASVSLSLRLLGFTSFLEEWWIELVKNFDVSRVEVELLESKIMGKLN